MSSNKLKVQTIILSKKHFRTRADVKRWIKANGYKLQKHKKQPIEGRKRTWRVRQRYSKYFKKSTLKTYKVKKGIKTIKGKLR